MPVACDIRTTAILKSSSEGNPIVSNRASQVRIHHAPDDSCLPRPHPRCHPGDGGLQPQDQKPSRSGSPNPLSGPQAPLGQDMKRGSNWRSRKSTTRACASAAPRSSSRWSPWTTRPIPKAQATAQQLVDAGSWPWWATSKRCQHRSVARLRRQRHPSALDFHQARLQQRQVPHHPCGWWPMTRSRPVRIGSYAARYLRRALWLHRRRRALWHLARRRRGCRSDQAEQEAGAAPLGR